MCPALCTCVDVLCQLLLLLLLPLRPSRSCWRLRTSWSGCEQDDGSTRGAWPAPHSNRKAHSCCTARKHAVQQQVVAVVAPQLVVQVVAPQLVVQVSYVVDSMLCVLGVTVLVVLCVIVLHVRGAGFVDELQCAQKLLQHPA
jgi:hypothetical protein